MKKGWRIALAAGAGLFVLFAAGVVVTKTVFETRFSGHITTSSNAWSVYAFDGIQLEECSFFSDKGQMLAGVKYSIEGLQPKGVVVFAHGFGAGGQRGYMDFFHRLMQQGYAVFAYDATANDKSEGDSVGGLPQGVADLDHAIQYAKQQPEYAGLPMFLMGYSWGAYSVGNVLNFQPDVQGAVILSGFDDSAELCVTEFSGQMGRYGWAAKLLRPCVEAYERLLFGKYAAVSAMSGFRKSDAPVMIVHGGKDTTVPPAIGYHKFYAKYGNDPRFTFVYKENCGHNIMRASGYLDEVLLDEIGAFLDSAL